MWQVSPRKVLLMSNLGLSQCVKRLILKQTDILVKLIEFQEKL